MKKDIIYKITSVSGGSYIPPLPERRVIYYTSSQPITGEWVEENTIKSVWSRSTGIGALYLKEGITTLDSNTPLQHNAALTNLNLSKSEITTILTGAFGNNTHLAEIIFPDTLENLSPDCVTSTAPLRVLRISNNEIYNDGNGSNCIIETDTNILVLGCVNTTIPGSVDSIGYKAFYDNDIDIIEIPGNISSIGESAFGHCGYLSTVYSYSLVPPVIESGNFEISPDTLYVPYAALTDYLQSPWADYFDEILPMDTPETLTITAIAFPEYGGTLILE